MEPDEVWEAEVKFEDGFTLVVEQEPGQEHYVLQLWWPGETEPNMVMFRATPNQMRLLRELG